MCARPRSLPPMSHFLQLRWDLLDILYIFNLPDFFGELVESSVALVERYFFVVLKVHFALAQSLLMRPCEGGHEDRQV